MTDQNHEAKLAAQNAALAKMSPLAQQRRELFLEFGRNMAEGGNAIIDDCNDPAHMSDDSFIGREWYNTMKAVKDTGASISALFMLKGLKADLVMPTDEDKNHEAARVLRQSLGG